MLIRLISPLVVLTAFITTSFILPNTALAAKCNDVETSLINCTDEGGEDDSGGIRHILLLVLDIFGIGAGILAVIGIAWAGIQYLTAGGDATKSAKSRRRIFEVVIGVACYALLWGFARWLLPGNINLGAGGDVVTNGDLTVTYNKINEIPNNSSEGNNMLHVTDNTSSSSNGEESYTLSGDDKNILEIKGRYYRCVSEGTTNVTVTKNGKSATVPITCVKKEEKKEEENKTNTLNGQTSSGGQSTPAQDDKSIASDGSSTTSNMENTRMNGGPNLRKETQQIIKAHANDFNYENYSSVIKKKGGYAKYVQGLGGVFSSYANQTFSTGEIKKITVKTAADLQAAFEYVGGLLMIWGPDYDNNRGVHHDWASSNAFYKGMPNRSSRLGYSDANVNVMLESSKKVRTHCNGFINTFFRTTYLTNIHGSSAANLKTQLKLSKENYKKNNGIITKVSDLRVGDLVHYYSGSQWVHVTLVGEVYSDYIVMYDGGSRFMKNLTYKFKVKRTNNSYLGGTYSGYTSWKGVRPWKIDQSVTLKGIN